MKILFDSVKQLFCLIIMILLASQSYAQDNSLNELDDSNQGGKQLTKEDLILYLAQEVVVAAGVGFEITRLGDSMESVMKQWGEPVAARKIGFLNKYDEWLYQPDENTQVVLGGKEVLEDITIFGNSASLLRTARSARFGMSARELINLYSVPDNKNVSKKLEYDEQGINFFMEGGRLVKIVIFEPKA